MREIRARGSLEAKLESLHRKIAENESAIDDITPERDDEAQRLQRTNTLLYEEKAILVQKLKGGHVLPDGDINTLRQLNEQYDALEAEQQYKASTISSLNKSFRHAISLAREVKSLPSRDVRYLLEHCCEKMVALVKSEKSYREALAAAEAKTLRIEEERRVIELQSKRAQVDFKKQIELVRKEAEERVAEVVRHARESDEVAAADEEYIISIEKDNEALQEKCVDLRSKLKIAEDEIMRGFEEHDTARTGWLYLKM